MIFNRASGGGERVEPETLLQALRDAGFEPVCRATGSEEELDEVLRDVAGLVAVAGGDGSVRADATRLVGRDVPIAIVPMGTANNIARTLGVVGPPREALARLAHRTVRRFDMGRVRAPWGEEYFLEGAGLGIYADLLADYDPEKGKSVLRAVETVRGVLVDYTPHHARVVLDGESLSGYLVALEVLNTQAIGPRIQLAPDADPTDGMFDLVCVFADDGVSLFDYAAGVMSGSLEELDNVLKRRVRRVEFGWRGAPFHLDAEVRPVGVAAGDDGAPDLPEARIEIEVVEGALEIWVPAGDEES